MPRGRVGTQPAARSPSRARTSPRGGDARPFDAGLRDRPARPTAPARPPPPARLSFVRFNLDAPARGRAGPPWVSCPRYTSAGCRGAETGEPAVRRVQSRRDVLTGGTRARAEGTDGARSRRPSGHPPARSARAVRRSADRADPRLSPSPVRIRTNSTSKTADRRGERGRGPVPSSAQRPSSCSVRVNLQRRSP